MQLLTRETYLGRRRSANVVRMSFWVVTVATTWRIPSSTIQKQICTSQNITFDRRRKASSCVLACLSLRRRRRKVAYKGVRTSLRVRLQLRMDPVRTRHVSARQAEPVLDLLTDSYMNDILQRRQKQVRVTILLSATTARTICQRFPRCQHSAVQALSHQLLRLRRRPPMHRPSDP